MILPDKKWQRIIVIDLLYLGDLMFAMPFFKELRKNFPAARIDLVINSSFHSIMEGNSNFDDIYAYNKKWSNKQSLKFARELGRNSYDLGINIHGSWRTALLLKLINPSFTIGYGGQGRGLFLNRELKQPENQHMVNVYLDFLRKMDLNVETGLPYLEVTDKAKNEINKKLENWGIGTKAKLIALNTAGTWPTKRWSIEGFARLGDMLNRKYGKVIMVGSPSDLPRVEEIVKRMETESIIATGKTSLKELASLLARCNLVISNDSGPVHVAAAVGTPTITIFGPSDDVKYRPLGEKNQIVKTTIDCRPCGKHECPLGHHRCMNEIQADEIVNMIEKSGWLK
jgi:heptosyltransferase-2